MRWFSGLRERYRLTSRTVMSRKIPIAMFLSGGYQKSNAKVIADSIENLKNQLALF